MKIFVLLLAIVALAFSAEDLKNPVCGLEYAKNGNGYIACLGYFPKWSFNAQTNECDQFIYGGCEGNENSFHTRAECETMCKK